jgi:hypothetical protein
MPKGYSRGIPIDPTWTREHVTRQTWEENFKKRPYKYKDLTTFRGWVSQYLYSNDMNLLVLAERMAMSYHTVRKIVEYGAKRGRNPRHIDLLVKALSLDEEQAHYLHWLAATESGYKLAKREVVET